MVTQTQRAFLATLVGVGETGLPLYSIAARMGTVPLRQPTIDRLVKDELMERVPGRCEFRITASGREAIN